MNETLCSNCVFCKFDANSDNSIFNIGDTKSHTPVVNLLVKNNQKLLKLLSKA